MARSMTMKRVVRKQAMGDVANIISYSVFIVVKYI